MNEKGEILKEIKPASNKRLQTFLSLMQDKEATWWLGSKDGLYFFNEEKHRELQEFTGLNGFSEFQKDNKKWHILTRKNEMWVATETGLYLIEKGKGITERYHSSGEGKFYLPSSRIQHIYIDKAGVFYLATANKGLIVWNRKTGDVQEVNRKNGLYSNDTYATFEDEFGFLWVSSEIGLIQLDKEFLHPKIYLKQDGLKHEEFNKVSFFKNKNGKIYFGGLNGVIGFHPKDFKNRGQQDVNFEISEVKMLSVGERTFENITNKYKEEGEVVFHKKNQAVQIKFSLQDYLHHDEITYRYKIKGQNKDWINIKGNDLLINRMIHKRYQLVVQAIGKSNAFEPKEMTIILNVIRPIYFNWWFVLGLFFIISLGSYFSYQWRIQILKERQIELENTVSERTKKIEEDKAVIEEQAEQLKELDEVKSRFFANISHELRTPLTMILGPLSRVLKRNELNNKDFTSLSMMQQNGEKLLKRINELLDLSRLDAAQLAVNPSAVFLYNYFKRTFFAFESIASVKDIKLSFDYQLDKDLQLLIDTDKVEKIIVNYITNAVKFTSKNGIIKLTAKQVKQQLQISISDTGIGIRAEELKKVFDRFYQITNNNEAENLNQNGTGIGLALCQELAKVMEGKVWVTSEIGQGSTFFLEIPLIETFSAAAAEATFEAKTIVENTTIKENNPINHVLKPTILIVEDNTDLRNYIASILEDYYIIMAKNGKDALEQLMENNHPSKLPSTIHHLPSLIISDIMMPEMDGMELLKAIKSNDRLKQIPMIMLTARQSMEVKLDSLRIGVDDYITKPFKEEELLVRVSNLIKNSQSRLVATIDAATENAILPKGVLSAVDTEWLKEVENLIIENISNSEINIAMLSEKLSITPRRFQQKIKQLTGLTPKKYQRNIQLEIARRHIKSGKYPTIAEVSYAVGIDRPRYFLQIYKKHFGVSPSAES